MNVKAIVKGENLDCYGWDAEDELIITHKVMDLDAEHNAYLLHAINKTKGEHGNVINDQVIFIDNADEILHSESVFDDSFNVFISTPKKCRRTESEENK